MRDVPSAVLVGGETLYNVHDERRCAGRPCTIHNPSQHSMSGFPQHFRQDRGLMERTCPHGVGHPDPDDPQTHTRYGGVHGCDGCCR